MTTRRREKEREQAKQSDGSPVIVSGSHRPIPPQPPPWKKAESPDPYAEPHRHRVDVVTSLDPGPRESSPEESPEVLVALAMVNDALAWAGAGHPPFQGPHEEVEVLWVLRCAGLSRQEARAWELYCAGFSYESISVFMDRLVGDEPLSVGTVETYLKRGRAKLRKLAAS